MLLELNDVAVRLGGRSIIEGVSLKLAPGQCLALSGASGCGKTTLLRAIAGLVEADGHIVQRARRFAYLFQEPRLLPWLTARENVRLVRPEASAGAIDELLAALALRSGDAVAVQNYMKRHGWTFPVANDPDGELFRRLDLRVVPTALIVKDGRLLYSTSGWSSSWGLRLRLWLARFF